MTKPDPLAALRAQNAAKPETPIRDRKDRVDATFAPDAKKAREIIRKVDDPYRPFADIARDIAKVTGNGDVRAQLTDRADAFVQATELYFREELKPVRPIPWMGADQTGQLAGTPAGRPEHEVLLCVAWGALLRSVNEATKVGLRKRSRYHPVELQVDVDATAPTAATPEWN